MPTRFRKLFCRMVALLILVAGGPFAAAQLEGKIADTPIGIMYARNITQTRVLDYMKTLGARLEIGKSMTRMIDREEGIRESVTTAEDPLIGTAWFMVTGLLPTFESVTFQQVTDEAEARRMMKARTTMLRDGTTLTEEGGGLFRMAQSWNGKYPLAEGQKESDVIGAAPNMRSFSRTTKIIEEDGKTFVEMTQTYTTLFRYHDNMLYEADFVELGTMTLPTSASLRKGVSGTNDLGLEAFFDRIPQGIKLLGWNMLNSGIGTQIQQRDNEDVTAYDMRRSAGDLGLNAARAVMFDVDKAEGWLRFADENNPSVRGSLILKARNNSQLAKQLQDASGQSRFSEIVRDNAAATIHLCVRLPEDTSQVLDAVGTWLKQATVKDFPGYPLMTAAAVELAETLADLGQQRTLELLVKAGWTEGSGGVIYGGLQVGNNPELLRTIHNLLTLTPGISRDASESISMIDDSGQSVIRITVPASGMSEVDALGLKITHIYMTHQNSCLWFALGGENAIDIVRQSVSRDTGGGLASRVPLLQAHVDAKLWLSYPQDEPTGIASLLTRMDAESSAFPPGPMSFEFRGRGRGSQKPTALLKRVFELGGDQDASLRLEADESGLALHAHVGEAIAHYYAARMLDLQDSMIRRAEEQQAEQMKRVEELQKKAKE